ncbi:hypothetical protein GCM10010166_65200 [Couchioplanes caeruleus subsp. azureus]|nr:hypothetical protein GCM10010166_65200 [Couchioplanes caeruleus subsp. azureus]
MVKHTDTSDAALHVRSGVDFRSIAADVSGRIDAILVGGPAGLATSLRSCPVAADDRIRAWPGRCCDHAGGSSSGAEPTPSPPSRKKIPATGISLPRAPFNLATRPAYGVRYTAR